ncbi:MAG: potassium channel family protein, partial [Candidatus Aminicenantes bacterium]|nr:potassium channel family protein [Candidatus Aminicenantes bacterium]
KYLGGVVSFATIFNGLQILSSGRAFIVPNPSPVPYFDLFYFSIVTIATIGYGDIQPALWVSRSVTILEIAFGLGFVLLLFTMLISVYIDIQKRKQ